MKANSLIRIALPALLFSLLTGASCNRGANNVPDEFETQGSAGYAMPMGELEEAARGFIQQMTLVVESTSDRPAETYQHMETFLESNRPGLEENARALEAQFAAFSPAEKRAWELAFSNFMSEAWGDWRAVTRSMEVADAQLWRRVSRVIDAFDGEE